MRREAPLGHRGILFVALAAILATLWSPPGVAAQARSYHVESFHSTIDVAEDGSIDVREQITFRFDGRFNGVFRTIPVEYRTPQGFRYHLYLDVVNVTDEGGSTLRYEESREGNYRKVKIWVPGAVDTSRTVTIRYTSPNALRFFDGGDDGEFSDPHDELYWNVTGDEWEVPIHSASAVVELPAGASGLRAAAFTGGYGSRERAARIDTLDSGFYFETTRVLEFREGLTIAVAWDPGVVRRPGFVRKAGWFLGANWILLFPVVVTALMGWLWHTRGRDPEMRSIMPHYEPPEHLAPAEVGTLVDNKPDTRDVVATLVDLAVRGYLRIEEVDKNRIHEFFTGPEYRFVRTRDGSEWTGLHDHERELLQGLFGGGGTSSQVMLSDLENEFYKHLEDIKKGIFRRLMDLGLYHKRPDKVKGLYLTVGGVIAVGGFVLLQFVGLLSAAVSPTSMVVAVVGSALPVIGFGLFMPARTVKGTRMLEEVLGFEEFLDRVEEDRFRRMITGPEMFEKYLPHAMALGVDKKWARAFEDLVTEPPDWYRGSRHGRFHTTHFCGSLGDLTAHTGKTFASSPRSSGGSGFGGGGGGGGGFGGGGGGAF